MSQDPTPDPEPTNHHEPETPLDNPITMMREVLEALELEEIEEEENALRVLLTLERVDVHLCAATLHHHTKIHVGFQIPISAPAESRSAVGEFLHRLNEETLRKAWGLNYDNGRIRCSLVADNYRGEFSADQFKQFIHYLAYATDIIFPFLTGVINGHMRPDVAADQAQAALESESSDQTSGEED